MTINSKTGAARALIVSVALDFDTSFENCLRRCLGTQGILVQCLSLNDRENDPIFLASAIRAFQPTLVIWFASYPDKGSSIEAVLDAWHGMCINFSALQFRPLFPARSSFEAEDVTNTTLQHVFLPLPDAAYRQSNISLPGKARRSGVACTQRATARRVELLARANSVCRFEGPFACSDQSWPGSVRTVLPGSNLAYYLRLSRYAVFFEDEANDLPGTMIKEACLRISEGQIVLVEEGCSGLDVLPKSLRDTLVTYPENGLVACVERLEREGASEVFRRQQKALSELPTLEDQVSSLLLWLNEGASQLGLPPVIWGHGAPVRVTLFGWLGARNFGDDLLMELVVDRFRTHYDNVKFSVIGADANQLRMQFGVEAAAPHERCGVRKMLCDSDVLIFLGGLLFDDPMAQTAGDLEFMLDPWIEPSGQAAVCLLARSLGVPSVFLGIGAGPLESGAARRMICLDGLAGARFLPRDEETEELLLQSGVKQSQIRLRADLVLGAKGYIVSRLATAEAVPDLPEGPFFTVSLREWPHCPDDFCERMASEVDAVIEKTGYSAVFLPFCADDIKIHDEVIARLSHRDAVLRLDALATDETVFPVIGRSVFAIAMRLHCSVLHHVLGKPAVGIDYNDKIGEHFRRMGEQSRLVPLDFLEGAVVSCACDVVDGYDGICNRVREGIAPLEGLVDEAFDDAFALVDASCAASLIQDEKLICYPRNISLQEQRARVAERRIGELEEERNRLAMEVSALRSSHSYRFGNFLMRGPAKLRNLLRR